MSNVIILVKYRGQWLRKNGNTINYINNTQKINKNSVRHDVQVISWVIE